MEEIKKEFERRFVPKIIRGKTFTYDWDKEDLENWEWFTETIKAIQVQAKVKPANGYNEAVDELLKYLGDSLILTLKINYVDYHDDYDILKRLLDRVNIEKSLSV